MLNFGLPGFHKTSIVRDEKGFTLIEVLIAIALSAVIVSGVLITIGTASKMLVRTKNQETAKDIASMEMEYIRSLGYAASYTLPALPAIYNNFTLNATNTPPFIINATLIHSTEEEIEIDVFLKGSATPIYTLVDYRAQY
jgi:prepilin-type N-terminal cleavage/methylation domain-containing protein